MRYQAFAMLIFLAVGLPALAAEKQLLVPETTTILGGELVQEGQVAVYDPDTETYTIDGTLSVPGSPPLDAIHKLSNPGQYLFSTKDPLGFNNIPPDALTLELDTPGSVYANDIIRYDGESGYSRFFCNLQLTDALPPAINIDAFYLDGGDNGDLILSIDEAATLGGVTYTRNDLLRYHRTGSGCGDWDLVGYEFNASTLDGGVPPSPLIPLYSNVVGVTRSGDQIFFALDTPSDLGASAYNPYRPPNGELATWNVVSGTFTLNATFAGLPTSPNTFPNSVAAPPPSCIGLGNPDLGDGIVDLCGANWTTDAGARRFRIEWLPIGGTLQYTVYRGLREDLCLAGLDFAIVAQTINNYYIEQTDPPINQTFYYLIVADDGPLSCGNPPGCGGCCTRVILPGACP